MNLNKAMPIMIRRAIKKGLIIIDPDGDWYELRDDIYYNIKTGVEYVEADFKMAA